jgi:hypothetical protein
VSCISFSFDSFFLSLISWSCTKSISRWIVLAFPFSLLEPVLDVTGRRVFNCSCKWTLRFKIFAVVRPNCRRYDGFINWSSVAIKWCGFLN